jgi:signal transduction histidine kinase
VTEDKWVACSVLDHIRFGLEAGGELEIQSTICNEIRQSPRTIVISHVAQHADFCDHHTPRRYGFQSYISVPIILEDQSFFGTLCAIDPNPAELDSSEVVGMFELFAQLIAFHIDAADKVALMQAKLSAEQAVSEQREEFVSMASRDIRDPLTGVMIFSKLLEEEQNGPLNNEQRQMVEEISKSSETMLDVVNSYLDRSGA